MSYLRAARQGWRADRVTKTDMIASMFTSRPFSVLTPKEISRGLGMDLRMVTSIVNRLRNEGLIDRVGWGRYQLNGEAVMDPRTIESILDEFVHMSEEVLGTIPFGSGHDGRPERIGSLVEAYKRVSFFCGPPLATNVLRICTRRVAGEDRIEEVVKLVSEGSSKTLERDRRSEGPL